MRLGSAGAEYSMRLGSDLHSSLEESCGCAQFNGQMTIGKLGKIGDEYTYEAWSRSPLEETGPADVYAVWYCCEKR